MNPQNGLVGDDYGTSLPETQMVEDTLQEEKKMAQFSKTAEFKRLKDYMEAKIEWYKTRQPNGDPIAKVPTPEQWLAANIVIAEFRAVLAEYELAAIAVKEKHA